MAYGVIAFEDKDSAQSFIDEQGTGKLMSAVELAEHTWEVNRDMMHMEDMDMHHEKKHAEEGDAHGDTGMEHDGKEEMEEGSHS
ncbi:hypothetical protein D3C78_1656300 [compost metagenome]